MRSHALIHILLAVIFNNASAALLRYKEHPVRQVIVGPLTGTRMLISRRHRHYGRSFNESIIAAAASETTDSISTQSLLSSQTPTRSSLTASVVPTALSKQVGSAPAQGSSDNAAKIDPLSLTQLSSVTTADGPEKLAPTSTPSKQVGSVPAEGSGEDAAKIDQQSSSQAQASGTSAATLAVESVSPQVSSASATFQGESSATLSLTKPATTLVTKLSLGTGVTTPASLPQTSQFSSDSTFSPSSTASNREATASTPTASSTSEAAGPSLSLTPTSGGNLAMAVAFNKGYKSLTFDSKCDPQDRLQATVCINGLFASCNNAGRYTVSPCTEGKQCFALPLMSEGSTGINVMCESPSNAARVLQAESTAKTSQSIEPTAATEVSSFSTSAVPSATATPSSFATSSDQSQLQSSNTQGSETFSTQPDVPSSTFSSSTQSSVVTTSDATTKPLATPTSFQAETTLSADQSSSGTLGGDISPDVTPVTTTEQSVRPEPSSKPEAPSTPEASSTPEATSSTYMPLIISFPDSLPKPSGVPEGIEQLFPALALAQQTSMAFAQKMVQPSPLQQAPASIPTFGASIESVAPAQITTLPMANDDDNLEKGTVTVTVTTTARP
ncbi:MAG: hypothetical protein Q9169_000851 [Polycauliona sp. 2 TL-2023]